MSSKENKQMAQNAFRRPKLNDVSKLMDYIPNTMRDTLMTNEVIESCYDEKLVRLFQRYLLESNYKRNVDKTNTLKKYEIPEDELDGYHEMVEKDFKFCSSLNPYDFVETVLEDSDYFGEFYLTDRNKMLFIPHARKKKRAFVDPVLGPEHSEISQDFFARSLDGFHFLLFLNKFQYFAGKETYTQILCLQHLKSLALFTCLLDVPVTFIHFFFEETTDNFLRALAVYFQYYLQLWDVLVIRTEMRKNRLPSQKSSETDKKWENNLNDLRFFIARNYVTMILGLDKNMVKYHHLSESSSNGSDIINYELLYHFSAQIMLMIFNHENNLRTKRIILDQINKLFRVPSQGSSDPYDCLSIEDRRVLEGKFANQLSWNVSTPCLLELKRPNRDPKILQVGKCVLLTRNKRLRVLQSALLVPEENLEEANIKIGILGKPRADYPPLLNCSQITARDRNKGVMIQEEPPNIASASHGMLHGFIKPFIVMKEFPEKPYNADYSLLKRKNINRAHSINIWKKYVRVSDRFWYKIDPDYSVVNAIPKAFLKIFEDQVKRKAGLERRIKSLIRKVKRSN